MKPDANIQLTENVKVELPSSILTQLIISGVLHASECKCLDLHTKTVLWKSLLNSSLKDNKMEPLCQ